MGFSILKFFQPKDRIFFNLFEQAADTMVETSAVFLKAMNETGDKRFELLAHTNGLEHKADNITHNIYLELNKNFITPFDREDVHQLAAAFDDIVDYIDEIGHKMKNFEFSEFDDYVYEMSQHNDEAIAELKKALYGLRGMKEFDKVNEACMRVHSLESKVDLLYNQAIGDLVRKNKDNPVKIILMKDIYVELELISDLCQDLSNVIEGIIIKYS